MPPASSPARNSRSTAAERPSDRKTNRAAGDLYPEIRATLAVFRRKEPIGPQRSPSRPHAAPARAGRPALDAHCRQHYVLAEVVQMKVSVATGRFKPDN